MEQKDFENLIDMFASDGWKFYINSVKELERALTDGAADGAVTNDQWQFSRGQTLQLRSVLGYEQYIRLALEEKEAEASAPQEEDVNVDIV